jgi:hypothetical protein
MVSTLHDGFHHTMQHFDPANRVATTPVSHFSPDEKQLLYCLDRGLSANTAFFTSAKAKSVNWQLCLRCLTEADVDVSDADLRAALITCGTDIRAASSTVFNDAHRCLVQSAEQWKEQHLAELRAHLISQVLDIDYNSSDPDLSAWIQDMAAYIRDAVVPLLTEADRKRTIGPLVTESLDDIHAQVERERVTYYDRLMAAAKAECESAHATELARLRAQSDADVLAYRNQLKLDAAAAKDNLRL